MSLLIFIAESHDMHPNGVPCRKWGVKCSNDREKYGRKAVCHCASYSVILRATPEDNSAGESCDKACFVITEPKSWGFCPIQSSFMNALRSRHGGFSPIQLSLGKQIWAFPCPRARSGYIARPPVRTYGTPAQLLRRPFGRIALKKAPELAEGPPHRGHYP